MIYVLKRQKAAPIASSTPVEGLDQAAAADDGADRRTGQANDDSRAGWGILIDLCRAGLMAGSGRRQQRQGRTWPTPLAPIDGSGRVVDDGSREGSDRLGP